MYLYIIVNIFYYNKLNKLTKLFYNLFDLFLLLKLKYIDNLYK